MHIEIVAVKLHVITIIVVTKLHVITTIIITAITGIIIDIGSRQRLV